MHPGHSLSRLDALPGGGQLDENPLLADSSFLVELDEAPGPGHHGSLVKGEPGAEERVSKAFWGRVRGQQGPGREGMGTPGATLRGTNPFSGS